MPVAAVGGKRCELQAKPRRPTVPIMALGQANGQVAALGRPACRLSIAAGLKPGGRANPRALLSGPEVIGGCSELGEPV